MSSFQKTSKNIYKRIFCELHCAKKAEGGTQCSQNALLLLKTKRGTLTEEIGALCFNLRHFHSKTQFTSDITSKLGYSALISNLRFRLSKTQFTLDITSKVRISRDIFLPPLVKGNLLQI